MAGELIADFEKRFSGGRSVAAAFRHPAGEASVTVLFGPSGSGKTTILRCLAGLERPERGSIRFGDEVWLDAERGLFAPPQRRRVGYLFQEYALFPHMTVGRNVAYGLGRLGAAEREARAAEAIALLGLEGLEARSPRSLSGGEQQRVALARALVCRPGLLLLDEPLSALDAPTRERVRRDLRRLLRRAGAPAVVVTHDRTEALALGDRMVVVDGGRVAQSGPVHEVFSKPAGPSVARIVGVETIAPGQVLEEREGLATVAVGDARLTALVAEPVGRHVFVCIRSEDVTLERGPAPESSARNRLRGTVREVEREGPMVRVTLDCGFAVMALVTKQSCEALGLAEGVEVTAVVKAPSVHLVARE